MWTEPVVFTLLSDVFPSIHAWSLQTYAMVTDAYHSLLHILGLSDPEYKFHRLIRYIENKVEPRVKQKSSNWTLPRRWHRTRRRYHGHCSSVCLQPAGRIQVPLETLVLERARPAADARGSAQSHRDRVRREGHHRQTLRYSYDSRADHHLQYGPYRPVLDQKGFYPNISTCTAVCMDACMDAGICLDRRRIDAGISTVVCDGLTPGSSRQAGCAVYIAGRHEHGGVAELQLYHSRSVTGQRRQTRPRFDVQHCLSCLHDRPQKRCQDFVRPLTGLRMLRG